LSHRTARISAVSSNKAAWSASSFNCAKRSRHESPESRYSRSRSARARPRRWVGIPDETFDYETGAEADRQ